MRSSIPTQQEVKLTTQAGVNINFVNTTVNSICDKRQKGRLVGDGVVNKMIRLEFAQAAHINGCAHR